VSSGSNAGLGGSEPGGKCEGRTETVHSSVVRYGRLWRGCLLGFLMGMASGCYVYTPVAGEPTLGDRFELDLNDRGRVGMGDKIGTAASKIEGTLKPGSDSAYHLSVISVEYLNGQSNKWTGEPLTVAREFVSEVKQRQFSRSRTFLTAAAIAIGVVAFIATRGLGVFGSPDHQPGGGEPPPQS
jgi:hypothetical protein